MMPLSRGGASIYAICQSEVLIADVWSEWVLVLPHHRRLLTSCQDKGFAKTPSCATAHYTPRLPCFTNQNAPCSGSFWRRTAVGAGKTPRAVTRSWRFLF